MDSTEIDTSDIRDFLIFIAECTNAPWKHQFHTTNWDYLLQREILALGLTIQPQWCANSHVYHLNGTVENLPDNQYRSDIVLETDSADARTSTIESQTVYSRIIWNKVFVVVGMSFECEVDKFILHSLSKIQDDLPIGESSWILVNPNIKTLEASSQRIHAALPCAKMTPVKTTFGEWLRRGMPELQEIGAIDPRNGTLP